MHCRDPEIYCKFRSSCPIHFLTKRKKNLDDKPQQVPETSFDQKKGKTRADRMYSGCQKNVPVSKRFFLQPLMPPILISEHYYGKRYN